MEAENMFCRNCGKEVQDDWKICPVCGESLNYDDKKDLYIRYPFASMLKRPIFTREGRRIRKKETEAEGSFWKRKNKAQKGRRL